MYLGWLVTVLVAAPNGLALAFPPAGVPERPPRDSNYRAMEIIERVGQAGCFGLPFFYSINRVDGLSVAALAIMAGALAIYYAGWARYLIGGRAYRLLFAPMFGVRLPMAVFPVLYFLAASAVLVSWPLAAAAILLAMGHLYVSRVEERGL